MFSNVAVVRSAAAESLARASVKYWFEPSATSSVSSAAIVPFIVEASPSAYVLASASAVSAYD